MLQDDFVRDAVALGCVLDTLTFSPSRGGDPHVLLKWRVEGEDGRRSSLQLIHDPVRYNLPQRLDEDHPDLEPEQEQEESGLVEDDAAIDYHGSVVNNVVEWRFSVVYSDTWRVPVLYFTVQDGHGSPFPRSEVLRLVKADQTVVGMEEEDTWDFLSYDEHPITGLPSFFLHPCQTDAILQRFQQSTKLLSWLSFVLPAVGFRIPPKDFALIQEQLKKAFDPDMQKGEHVS